MATQGLISITKNGNVIFKCVAGCNGMTAKITANALRRLDTLTLETVHKVCMEHSFGCEDCLAVQSTDQNKWPNNEEPIGVLYKQKFSDAKFNPRWDAGICDHTEIVELNPEYLNAKK